MTLQCLETAGAWETAVDGRNMKIRLPTTIYNCLIRDCGKRLEVISCPSVHCICWGVPMVVLWRCQHKCLLIVSCRFHCLFRIDQRSTGGLPNSANRETVKILFLNSLPRSYGRGWSIGSSYVQDCVDSLAGESTVILLSECLSMLMGRFPSYLGLFFYFFIACVNCVT